MFENILNMQMSYIPRGVFGIIYIEGYISYPLKGIFIGIERYFFKNTKTSVYPI